jgi:hypothetical protein
MRAVKIPVPRRLRVVLIASALAVATSWSMATSPARATYCNPCVNFSFSNLSPPVGTSFVYGEPHPEWTMNAPTGLFPFVRVSTSPETGTDGHTLSGLYEVPGADFYLSESGTIRGFYRTDREEPIREQPAGIYYWQMESGRYQTQIYSFVVTAKPLTPQPSPTPNLSNSPGKSPETERQTPLRCHLGYTKAQIGGKTMCLHSGGSCSLRYRKQYRRYHFACLRKGTHYKLVRRR